MREGAVDVYMKIRREVVNTEVITPPKADNTFLHVCTNGTCTVYVAVKNKTMKNCNDFVEIQNYSTDSKAQETIGCQIF